MITIDNKVYNADLYLRLSREKIDEYSSSSDVTTMEISDYDVKERESGSITNQRAYLTRFCKENQIHINNIYSDDGFSGASFDRPGFNEMLKDIENKKVDMVIVKDLSRLGRVSSKVTYYTDEYFPEHKIRFIAVADNIDTGMQETSSDEMAQFKAFFNEWFLRDCSKKTKNGKKSKAKDGKVMTTYATYGYKKDPKDKNHYIIDQDVAPIIKEIFEIAKEGKTPTQIARIMTEKNVKLPCDVVGNTHTRTIDEIKRRWNRNTVKRILMNQEYLGKVINGKARKINYKSKKIILIPKDEWIISENMHEAIIDKDTFNIVQELIKSRTSTRTRKHDWLLNGLLKCAECGKNLSLGWQKSRWTGKSTYYTGCNTYRINTALHLCTPHSNNIEILTKAVIENIKSTCKKYLELEKIKYNDIIKEEDRKLKNEINNNKNEINNINKKISIVNKKIEMIYDDKLNGILTSEDFKKFYKSYNDEKKELQDKANVLKEDSKNEEKVADFDAIINDFVSQKKISREQLVQLVDKITISQEKVIKIYYKFNILNKLDKQENN